MTSELRVVDKEHYRVDESRTVREDVQNVQGLCEVQFFVTVAKVLNEPHDLMREQADGEHDDVSEHHAHDTVVTVTAAGALGIKDSEAEITYKEINIRHRRERNIPPQHYTYASGFRSSVQIKSGKKIQA